MNQRIAGVYLLFMVSIVGFSSVESACSTPTVDACNPARTPALLGTAAERLNVVKACLRTQFHTPTSALGDWSTTRKPNINKYTPGFLWSWGPKVKFESWGSKENAGKYDTTKWTSVYDITAGFQLGRESITAANAVYGAMKSVSAPKARNPVQDGLPFDPYYIDDKGTLFYKNADTLERTTTDLIDLERRFIAAGRPRDSTYEIAALYKLYPESGGLAMSRGNVLSKKSDWSEAFYGAFKNGVNIGKTNSGYDSSAGLGLYLAVNPEESREHGGSDARLVKCPIFDDANFISIDSLNSADDCRVQNLVDANILVDPSHSYTAHPLERPNTKNMWAYPYVLEKAARELKIMFSFRAGRLAADNARPPFVVDKNAIDYKLCSVADPVKPILVETTTTTKIVRPVLIETVKNGGDILVSNSRDLKKKLKSVRN